MSFRFLISTAVLLIHLLANAQVKEVIFIEGGSFGSPGNKVFFNSYNPKTKKAVAFDSIPGDFTHGALVNGHFAFLYAGNMTDSLSYLCKYDLRSRKLLAKTSIPGLQQMAIYQDKIIVTKGYPVTSKFVAVYSQTTLAKLAEFSEINLPTQGLAIYKDKAYIAVEGNWPSYTDSGTIAVINLKILTAEKNLKLDSINKVFRNVTSYANNLYFIGDSLITTFNSKDNTFTHKGFNKPFKVMDVKGKEMFIKFKDDQVAKTNLDSLSNAPNIWFTQPSIVGLYDPLNSQYFSINTDYFSFGHLIQHSRKLNTFDTLNIKIAAESMAFYEKAMENFDDYWKVDPKGGNLTFDILSNDTILSNHPFSISLTKTATVSGNSASIQNNKLNYIANGTLGIDTLIYDLCDSITFQCTSAKIVLDLTAIKLSVSSINDDHLFYIYNNILHYKTSASGEKLELYNLMGEKMLQHITQDTGELMLNYLSDGMYFIRYQNKTYPVVK